MKAVDVMKEERVIAIIRTDREEDALRLAYGAAAGGMKLIEITYSVKNASEVIRKLALEKGIVLGAGTILDIDTASGAIDAGASFIVSPHGDSELIRFCVGRGVCVIPGCMTPTEVMSAYRSGTDMVKIFPASAVGGPGFIKALRGPLPFMKYVPTGGVDRGNIKSYLEAGAFCAGIGGALLEKSQTEEQTRIKAEDLIKYLKFADK